MYSFLKYLFFWILFFILWSTTQAQIFIQKKIDGKTIKIIQYSLSSKEYDIKIGYTENATNMRDLMEQYNGVSAINWVFFCPADYGECNGKTFTINEHYIKWEKIATYDTTGDRVVFWWDKDKVPLLFQTDKINKDKEWEIYEWFANHPLLLKDGENMLEYWYDSYLIDKKMLVPALRNFICSDEKKENIYFWVIYDVSLDDEIPILKKIGCFDALNLDAGKSTAFVYNGRYLLGPQRDILDGVIIERKWLDTKKTRLKWENIFVEIMGRISKSKKQKEILEWLQKKLSDIRVHIYDKNSMNTIDSEGKIDGYKIDIRNIKTLEKIYMINYLNSLITKKLLSI